MKKYLAILLSVGLLMVALVALSGCQKAQTSQAPATTSTTQTSAPATPATTPATQASAAAAQTPAAGTQAPAASASQPSMLAPVTQAPAASAPAASAPASLNPWQQYLQGVPSHFVPANAVGVTCTYQMNLTDGPDMGLYWIKIDGGQCTVGDGQVSNPTLTINTPEQLWLDMIAKKADATSTYMSGQWNATPLSHIQYLQNMAHYFGQ